MGNYKNLSDENAIAKLKELAEGIKTCMFSTDLETLPISSRPMGLQEVDDKGNLWFISSRSSNKNFEIKEDDRVQLFFAQNSSYQYLSVFGNATIYRDQSKIDEIWTPIANAWFEQGKEDPDVTVIKVAPSDIYYWDNEDSKVVSLLKIAVKAVGANVSDGGVEGKMHI